MQMRNTIMHLNNILAFARSCTYVEVCVLLLRVCPIFLYAALQVWLEHP